MKTSKTTNLVNRSSAIVMACLFAFAALLLWKPLFETGLTMFWRGYDYGAPVQMLMGVIAMLVPFGLGLGSFWAINRAAFFGLFKLKEEENDEIQKQVMALVKASLNKGMRETTERELELAVAEIQQMKTRNAMFASSKTKSAPSKGFFRKGAAAAKKPTTTTTPKVSTGYGFSVDHSNAVRTGMSISI